MAAVKSWVPFTSLYWTELSDCVRIYQLQQLVCNVCIRSNFHMQNQMKISR